MQSKKAFTLERPEKNSQLSITEVIFGSIEGPDTISWYFEVDGHYLVANLSFWKGDPNEEKYRQVLRDLVRIVSPLTR